MLNQISSSYTIIITLKITPGALCVLGGHWLQAWTSSGALKERTTCGFGEGLLFAQLWMLYLRPVQHFMKCCEPMRNKSSAICGRAKSSGEHTWCGDEAVHWDSSGMIKWLYFPHCTEEVCSTKGWRTLRLLVQNLLSVYFLND